MPLRDVQIAARHADPRTTTGYTPGPKHNLDRHASYIVTAFVAWRQLIRRSIKCPSPAGGGAPRLLAGRSVRNQAPTGRLLSRREEPRISVAATQ